MFTVHSVKILEKYANDILYEGKNFEIRKDDRNYQVGDVMEFLVIDENGNHLKDHPLFKTTYVITYKHKGTGEYGITGGYCVLGIKRTDKEGHNTIYTHDEASRILELFEDVLSEYDISVPSPEDDERDPDDAVGLYGSTYSDLLDDVEALLIDILDKHKVDTEVEKYMYSGKY